MTYNLPFLRTILQSTLLFFMDALTFIVFCLFLSSCIKRQTSQPKVEVDHAEIDRQKEILDAIIRQEAMLVDIPIPIYDERIIQSCDDVARLDTTYRRKLLESDDNRIKYDTAKQKAIKFYQNALQLLRAPLPPDADSNQRKIADKKIQKFAADSATTVNNKLLEIFFHDNGKFDFRYVFYSIGNKPTKMLGFFITAIALSLGAPFWFDLLNKFVNIRGGGKVVDSSGSASKNNTSTATTIDG